jgi:hypothetical protein
MGLVCITQARVATPPFDIFSWPTAFACSSTASTWIYNSGVAGILSTFPLLTFAIELFVEHFFKTVVNRGRSFPVVRAKSGWSNTTKTQGTLIVTIGRIIRCARVLAKR